MTWVFSPPRGPFRSVGHTASRLRQNPVEPQSYFRSHISCSSSGTSKPNSSWCIFPPQAHREPPLRGAAPLNSPRSEKSAWEKKVGSFLLRALSLSLPSAKSFHDLEVWHLFHTFWLQAVETLLLFILLKAAIVKKKFFKNPLEKFMSRF